MTNRIGFFGASVTQQENGYTYHLSKKLNVEHICFGYGGNHIKDAGICFIDEVINKNLNYCFIDFFSTGYISTDNKTIEYLDTIIYKFTKSECKLVFLFLLNSNHNNRIPFYKFLYDYLTSKKIYFIDVNDYIEYSSTFCRDNVHTTEAGSIKYSDIIYNVFQKDKDKIILSPLDIVKTKYCDNIKTLCVNKSFQNSFFIEGECLIIAFYITIGPKSGIIKINNINNIIWDPWCHYDRNHFNLHDINVNGKLKIEVLQDNENIDYLTCRRQYNFTNLIKELNIIKIYYIGYKLILIED